MTKKRTLPIDRGWAWVILLCYFTNGVLMMGYYKSFGIVFVEMLRKFKSTTSATSLLIGVQSAFISIGGLLTTTVLMTYFSGRQIVILGGCLLSTGIVLTVFAPSLAVVILFQSVLVGLGVVMIFSPGQTLVCQYFNKRRGLALSLGMAGTSVGALVTPPVLRALLDTYGLNGALLIHGAIVLNVVVFGSLMRPLESYMKQAGVSKEEVAKLTGPDVQEKADLEQGDPQESPTRSDRAEVDEGAVSERRGSPHVSNGDVTAPLHRSSSALQDSEGHVHSSYPSNLPDECGRVRSITIPMSTPFHAHEFSDQVLRQRYHPPKSLSYLYHDDLGQKSPLVEVDKDGNMFKSLPNLFFRSEKKTTPEQVEMNGIIRKLDAGNAPLKKTDDVDGTVSSDRQHLNRDEKHKLSSSKADLEEKSKPLVEPKASKDNDDQRELTCMQRVTSLFEVALFKELRFYLVLVVSGLSILPTILPISYLPALAADRGLSDVTAAHLLMVSAVCGIVARVVFGLVIDSGRVRINYVAGVTMIFMGVGVQFVHFVHTEPVFMFLAVFLGLFGDAYFFVLPIWIVVSYGEVMFRKVFGFSLLMEGMFLCMGSPFCGWLRDSTGSFDAVYHFLGACSIASAVIMIIEARLPPSEIRQEFDLDKEEKA